MKSRKITPRIDQRGLARGLSGAYLKHEWPGNCHAVRICKFLQHDAHRFVQTTSQLPSHATCLGASHSVVACRTEQLPVSSYSGRQVHMFYQSMPALKDTEQLGKLDC